MSKGLNISAKSFAALRKLYRDVTVALADPSLEAGNASKALLNDYTHVLSVVARIEGKSYHDLYELVAEVVNEDVEKENAELEAKRSKRFSVAKIDRMLGAVELELHKRADVASTADEWNEYNSQAAGVARARKQFQF